MNPIQTIAKNTAFLFLADVFGKLCLFALSVLIARKIGVLAFGDYSFAMDFTFLFMTFAIFGFNAYITREIAGHPEKALLYVNNILSLKIILAGITILLLVLATFFLPHASEVKWLVLLIGLAGIMNTFTLYFRSIFVAYERMGYDALLNVLEKGLFFLFAAGAFFYGGGLWELGIAYFFALGISLLVAFFFCRKKFLPVTFAFDLSLWKTIFIATLPFIGTSFFGMVYLKLHTTMLSFLQDNIAVGLYNAGYQIVDGLRLIPIIFIYALFPAMSRFAAESKEKLLFTTQRAAKYIALGAFPIAVGGIVLAEKLLITLYGIPFLSGARAFRILLLALSFIYITRPLYLGIMAIDKHVLNFYLAVAAILATSILNTFLIPTYGIEGAAITLLLVETMLFCSSYWFFRKHIASIPWIRLLAKPFLAALLMGGVVFLLREQSIFLTIPLGALSYLFFLFLFCAWDKEDKKIMLQILTRRESQ